jgi:DNA-binding XRE family transcriptional regulator
MLALEGMMNAQRNRGIYLRVSERLAEIRKSRKISQAKLAKLLGLVEGTIQNYEHGRNEPNITRLYDVKRAPRVEYICRHSQQQIACLPVVPIGKQAQIRNVVVCHLSVGRCEYAFRSTPANGSPARCAPLPKPRISACSTFNSPKPTAVRSSCRCSSVNCLSSLPKSALARAGCVDRGLAPTLVIVKP